MGSRVISYYNKLWNVLFMHPEQRVLWDILCFQVQIRPGAGSNAALPSSIAAETKS